MMFMSVGLPQYMVEMKEQLLGILFSPSNCELWEASSGCQTCLASAFSCEPGFIIFQWNEIKYTIKISVFIFYEYHYS